MSSSPYAHACIVANPVAGSGRGGVVARQLERKLGERLEQVELFLTGKAGDATQKARDLDASVDLVVVAGGDGTLREVLAGLSRPVPIAVLAMGTANVLREDLGLPRTPDELISLIETGRVGELDVAEVTLGEEATPTLSFLVTGIGFDAYAVRRVAERRKGPISKWFYVSSVLAAFWNYQAPELRVDIDGRELEAPVPWILISNVGGYGGIWRLSPDRRIDDGLFEVYLLPARSRWSLIRIAWAGFWSGLPTRALPMRAGRSVRVRSSRPVPVEIDGDFAGTTPLDLAVQQRRARICLP